MVSSNAGTLWGMEGKIGVLAEGAIGNMVILSGDPLSLQSKVIKVWVAGNEAYDRANDVRLQRLLEGAEQ
jgi:imidazolonepropionase-like amidohydrolase